MSMSYQICYVNDGNSMLVEPGTADYPVTYSLEI